MSKGVKKKRKLEGELAELHLKKRNGYMRLAAAVVAFVVVTIGKETLVAQGVEWASHMVANMVFYLFAIVMAGVAGLGVQSSTRAERKIREINSELSR